MQAVSLTKQGPDSERLPLETVIFIVVISGELSDDVVMRELGRRIAQLRIDLNYPQEYLAERAGVGKRTLERLEKGKQVQTSSLVRVLRSLGQMDVLEGLLPAADIRPMDLLRLKKNRRQRARSSLYEIPAPPAAWIWEDEKGGDKP
jgi:transcriptional regulator with XRE-family HTH domain